MIHPTPIYRFFSKKEYADDLINNGNVRFTPVSAFTTHEDEQYRDMGEKYYHFKVRSTHTHILEINGVQRKIEGGSVTSKYRRIDDAWAFCATTSIVSSARKAYPTYIKDFGLFIKRLETAIENEFNEKLLIMAGPVAYYNRFMDIMSEVPCPPYFSKPEKFLTDLEFRIVIIPSKRIYDLGQINSITIKIENPQEVFGTTLIAERPSNGLEG